MNARNEIMTVRINDRRIQATTRAFPNLALYAKLRSFQDDFSAEFLGKVKAEFNELTEKMKSKENK